MRRREDGDHAVPIDDVASREPAAFSLLDSPEGAVSPDVAANTYVRVTWRVVSHQYRVSAWQVNRPRDYRLVFCGYGRLQWEGVAAEAPTASS